MPSASINVSACPETQPVMATLSDDQAPAEDVAHALLESIVQCVARHPYYAIPAHHDSAALLLYTPDGPMVVSVRRYDVVDDCERNVGAC